MKLLVTGSSGFIGARTTEMLLDDGHEVVGVDDMNDYYDIRLKQWRLDKIRGHENASEFKFHQQDIADLDAMRQLFDGAGFDAVLNLAARAGVRYSVENPWIYQRTNMEGTLNLLEMCRQHDVGRFVLASTSSLYGHHNEVPFKETANTDRPPSPYAATKKAAEALASVYSDLYGIHTPTPRYFTVYGPAGRPDMAPYRFIDWISRGVPVIIYGDGSQRRDFTYVDDIARGTTLMLQEHVKGHEVFNLGNDNPVVLMDFLKMIEEAVGKKAEVRFEESHPADMHSTWADVGKAKATLHWHPQVTVSEGLDRTIEDATPWSNEVATT